MYLQRYAAWTVVGCLALSAGTARADNSTTWTTDLLTVTNSSPDASWDSSTDIPPGFPPYHYTYSVLDAELHVNTGSQETWIAFEPLYSDNYNISGDASTLPVTMLDDSIDEDFPSLGHVNGDVLLSIDADGQGHLALSGFTFSHWLTAARVKAQVTVTGVPEPASLSLMGLAGGLLLMRRRRTAAGH